MKNINYEIQRGSYEENAKFNNDLAKTIPDPKHPQRVKRQKAVNEIGKRMNETVK